MPDDLLRLGEREKAVLRLLACGHDAKSAAQALGISVHTVNERLRDARRTLGASSSREAARALAEAEGSQENWPEKIGVDAAAAATAKLGVHDHKGRARRRTVLLLGVATMLSLVAAFLIDLQTASPDAPAPHASAPPAPAAAPSRGPIYLLSFEIAATGGARVQPRLTVRAGEMASIARSGMGGSDFDVVALASPDPNSVDHVMLTIKIVASGPRQLQTQRSASVAAGEPIRVELRGDDGAPVVTLIASARPVAA